MDDGRAPTFPLATGYEQVRSIAAALAGDWEAARDVQLDLPPNSVCSGPAVAGAASTARVRCRMKRAIASAKTAILEITPG